MMNITKIETNNLPSLKGASEKQIQYGEDMRMRLITTYNHFLTAYDEIDDDAMFAVEGETLDLRFYGEWSKEKQNYKAKGEPIPKGSKEQFREKMRVEALMSKKAEIEQMINEHKDAKWWIEHK